MSVVLAVFAVVLQAGVCWSRTPTAVSSPCGTCRAAARAELYEGLEWAEGLCLAAWLLARGSGSRPAARVARAAGLAAAGMGGVALGFVWGWW